jgi:hypothetical protein
MKVVIYCKHWGNQQSFVPETPPLEGAYKEEYWVLERLDMPRNIGDFVVKPKDEWYTEGRNHRESSYGYFREMKQERWCIDIETFDQFWKLFTKGHDFSVEIDKDDGIYPAFTVEIKE